MKDGFIPPHGGYRNLLSYQRAEMVYDLTVIFCRRFLEKRDRTVDQMIQAARSGKQNIAEGSQASGTSTETEIKLTSVARASLEELLIDYEDFLRVRSFPQWPATSREGTFVRKVVRRQDGLDQLRNFAESRPAEVVANIALCVIRVSNFLLDRQLRGLEKKFLAEGGIRERMTRARFSHRGYDSRP